MEPIARNVTTVRRWVDAGNRRDLDVFDELFTVDTVDHVGGKSGVLWWKQIYERINASFPDWRWSSVAIVADHDAAMVRATMIGSHHGSELPFLQGIEPTGRPISWTHHHSFRMVGGQIAEHWANRDDLGVLRQLRAGAE